ncbi:MAG: gamma-glutamyl-gamma-aminobutyrate hydrolase family protein [Spirochaetes bacterium]|nr:gamma-glutamyl-gamma-aminobutyrate hydrolase family protein [Spirochaetota bacterium]
MKRVLISQRVDVITSYQERRDALDQRWAEFLWEAGCIGMPVFNHEPMLAKMLESMQPDGILLSGGNTPEAYGGSAPERDTIDEFLISYAIKKNVPLLGVCRGTQSIALYFGGTLRKIEGHVAIRHNLDIKRNVNSYHNFAPDVIPEDLLVLAISADGEVEYIKHRELPIAGIMWHPEREAPFAMEDIELVRGLFAAGVQGES